MAVRMRPTARPLPPLTPAPDWASTDAFHQRACGGRPLLPRLWYVPAAQYAAAARGWAAALAAALDRSPAFVTWATAQQARYRYPRAASRAATVAAWVELVWLCSCHNTFMEHPGLAALHGAAATVWGLARAPGPPRDMAVAAADALLAAIDPRHGLRCGPLSPPTVWTTEAARRALGAFVRAQYRLTQAQLRRYGVRQVTLWRGLHGAGRYSDWLDPAPTQALARVAPLAAWTPGYPVAAWYAGAGWPGEVVAATVPAARIWALAWTGIEGEVLVLGTPMGEADRGVFVRWDERAAPARQWDEATARAHVTRAAAGECRAC